MSHINCGQTTKGKWHSIAHKKTASLGELLNNRFSTISLGLHLRAKNPSCTIDMLHKQNQGIRYRIFGRQGSFNDCPLRLQTRMGEKLTTGQFNKRKLNRIKVGFLNVRTAYEIYKLAQVASEVIT